MAKAAPRVLTAHVPVSLVEKVDQTADRLGRSLGLIMKQALSSWIALEEECDPHLGSKGRCGCWPGSSTPRPSNREPNAWIRPNRCQPALMELQVYQQGALRPAFHEQSNRC